MFVGVLVAVLVGVLVAVFIGVFVGVSSGVGVSVAIGVTLGAEGVSVGWLGLAVGGTGVEVDGTGVFVGIGVDVLVADGGEPIVPRRPAANCRMRTASRALMLPSPLTSALSGQGTADNRAAPNWRTNAASIELTTSSQFASPGRDAPAKAVSQYQAHR